jgi:hypothetical protein
VDPTHSLNIEGSSLALEALGFSVVTISAFLEHSSSIPSEVSAPQTSFGGGFFIGFQVSSGSTFFGVENAAQSESRLNKFVAATQA